MPRCRAMPEKVVRGGGGGGGDSNTFFLGVIYIMG